MISSTSASSESFVPSSYDLSSFTGVRARDILWSLGLLHQPQEAGYQQTIRGTRPTHPFARAAARDVNVIVLTFVTPGEGTGGY
jgi:hypothetical protein